MVRRLVEVTWAMTNVTPVPLLRRLVSLPLNLVEGLIILVTVLPMVLVIESETLLVVRALVLPLTDPVLVVELVRLLLFALALPLNLPLNLVSVVLSLLLEKRALLGPKLPLLDTIGSFRRRVYYLYGD